MSTKQTASVTTDETQQIPAVEASGNADDGDADVDAGAEVPVDIQVDLADQAETETETVISMTTNGFEPSTVTVKAGTKVTFVNNDTVDRWPASAFHPTHLELPGFDALKGIAPGASYSFTFEKVGKWGFHDHLFPTMFGSVTVE